MCRRLSRRRIKRRDFYKAGGMGNPLLYRVARAGGWQYYVDLR